MKYFIYSFLIFNFLIISNVEMIAQDSLIYLNGQYGLIVKGRKSFQKVDDTLIYDTKTQGFNKLNGERTSLETHRTLKTFGAFAATNQLRKDGVVVILKSESKRLEQLKILSRDVNLSAVQRQNAKRKIELIEEEKEIINQSLIDAFTNVYDLSEVFFMYDTSITTLKSGIKQGVFTDKSGLIDENITLNNSNYYVCHYRIVNKSKDAEGLVIYNSEMEKLKPPFPTITVSGSTGFNLLLQLLTDNDNYYQKKIERDVNKLRGELIKILRNGERQFKKP